MANKIPPAYKPEKKQEALELMQRLANKGKMNFSEARKATGISVTTLKKWWMEFQLEKQQELKTRLETAITTILNRMEKLAQETNNLKELAPVVKMLSELLQQFTEETGATEEWG